MCPTRNSCQTLCGEAEAWANQDYVGQRELTIGLPRTGEMPELPANVYLTETECAIVTLLGRGLNRRDVCQVMDMSRETLRKHLERLRKKSHAFYPL